jgi:hypothetical protein
VIPFTAGQPQSQTVTSGSYYTAKAINGGQLQITAPAPIVSVSQDPSYTSYTNPSPNVALLTLSGLQGTIVVKWASGAATISVQIAGLSLFNQT